VATPKKKSDAFGDRVVAQNRAATYNYHVLETFEAGMALLGTEVKAVRGGLANLREAYAEVRNGEVWLVNCHIPEYTAGGPWNHGPLRTRKLLLHKQEIVRLAGKTAQKGLTLIALKIYLKAGRAKCQIALARGKKEHDRRAAIKERDTKREAAEEMRNYNKREG
jgi:SsrA-binding protein